MTTTTQALLDAALKTVQEAHERLEKLRKDNQGTEVGAFIERALEWQALVEND